jgi:hypothetical protein
LKSAPSIDANNWPDASDQTWRKQVDEFYDARTQSRVGGERPDAGLADVRRDDAGLDRPTADAKLHQRDQRGSEVGPDAGRAKVAGADQAMPGQSYRVSQIIGLSVQARDTTVARAGEPDVGAQADAADKPQQDETIGKIRDVLINRQAHRAMFVLVDYGGTLGVGEETAVAPFASFSFTRQQDAQALTMAQLNANHNALKQNRITNDQDVNALAQSDRARQVFQSYDQTPYWETFGYEAAEEPRGQLDKHDRSKTDTERTRDQLDKYKQDRSDRPERPESSPDQSNQ